MLMVLTLMALTCRILSVFILDFIAMAVLHFILGFYALAALPISYILGMYYQAIPLNRYMRLSFEQFNLVK